MSIDDPLASLPPLREVIRTHGLDARRSLGQHFLLDLNLTARIARAAGPLAGRTVIEVGPGPGGLTRSLLAAGAERVIAVERDPRAIAALEDLAMAAGGRLQLIEADALEVDPATLGPAPRCIVANLPYNISTPLLLKWLRQAGDIERMTLMFQREVADRLVARPKTKAYGRLSVMTQWLCQVAIEFNLPKEAFTPPPKVASTVVSLAPHPVPLAKAGFDAMERVVEAAFGQRRKMLRQSLKRLGIDASAAGLEPTARAEELGVVEFAALARLYAEKIGG